VIATNANDILHRFIANGDYSKPATCHATLAPAMDITIPSNFERYLFALSNDSGEVTSKWMATASAGEGLDLGLQRAMPDSSSVIKEKRLEEIRGIFRSAACSDANIEKTVAAHQREYAMTHCPHTACGIYAAEQLRAEMEGPIICCATAHHGKFGISMDEAEKMKPALPSQLKSVEGKPTRLVQCPNDQEEVKAYLLACVVTGGAPSSAVPPPLAGTVAAQEGAYACGIGSCVVS
jgi:threonine synthase